MANPALLQNRWVLPVMLGLLAGVVGLTTLLSPGLQNQEPLANRSIYNSAPSGYRAWYLTSQKAGLAILPWEKSFAQIDLLPNPATMMLVEPYTLSKTSVLFSQKESEAVLAWVAKGNTLLLLDDFHRFGSQGIAQVALDRVASLRKPVAMADGSGKAPRLEALPLLFQQKKLGRYVAQPVLSRSNAALWPKGQQSDAWTALLTDGKGNPQLVRLPYGKGTLILGTVADLGDNGFLHGQPNDNYQFLANLLREAGHPVFINEFIHGYAETENLFTYFGQNTPLGAIFAQLMLGFVLLIWLSYMRWTPKPREMAGDESDKAGVTGIEAYVQSMARLYYRTQAASLALSPQVHRIERLLRQRFRLTLDDEGRLKHLLGTSPADYSIKEDSPESLVEALRKARSVIRDQERLSHRDLLRLARQLTLIEERLQYERHRTHVLPR
jgi:hypothetical protein